MKNRIAEYLPSSWFKSEPGSRSSAQINLQALKAVAEPIEEFVIKHPGTSLAVAFAAGVALAWWLKRR